MIMKSQITGVIWVVNGGGLYCRPVHVVTVFTVKLQELGR